MHLVYLVSFNIYILKIYVQGHYSDRRIWSILMAAGIVYPFIYEIIQIK